MKEILRFFKLYRIFILQDMKRAMEYKGDFIVGVSGIILRQVFNIVFLSIIFNQIPTLKGWDFNQIVFIYGFSLIPKGIDHLLFDNLWTVAQVTIKKGEFDKYLTRPINSLFHVLVERFQVDGMGEIIVGLLLISTTAGRVHVQWTGTKVLLFLLVIPFATSIYTAIKIVTTSIAFWAKQSDSIIYMIYMVNDFAKYPTTIYNNAIKWVITYIIPFAFTAFYPASYFLTGENPLFNIGGPILFSIVFLLMSVWIWNKGIGAYESAGS